MYVITRIIVQYAKVLQVAGGTNSLVVGTTTRRSTFAECIPLATQQPTFLPSAKNKRLGKNECLPSDFLALGKELVAECIIFSTR